MSRARELRTFGNRGMEPRAYGSLVGHLLLRTWERAERIYLAMRCRGFDGQFHVRQSYRFGRAEVLFTLGWPILFILFRLVNVPVCVGSIVTGVFR